MWGEYPDDLIEDYLEAYGLLVEDLEVMYGAYREDNQNCKEITAVLAMKLLKDLTGLLEPCHTKWMLNMYFHFVFSNVYAESFTGPRSLSLCLNFLLSLYIVHFSSISLYLCCLHMRSALFLPIAALVLATYMYIYL